MIGHHPPRDAGGIAHHPDDELLLAYAGGAADEAVSLVIATHMAYCAICRQRSRELDAIGGVLLQDLPPAPLAEGALNAALAKLDMAAPYERPRRAVSRDGTPEVLRAYLGGDISAVRWRHLGPRLSYVPLFRRGDTKVRLLRGVPGSDSGPHSHHGAEYTVVLRGGFSDVTGRYGPGDLQVMQGDRQHNPIADPGEDCINLAVTTAPLKFENLLQKIAGRLLGF